MSNLSDIGFPVQSEQDVNGLIEDLLSVVKPIRCNQGAYYIYTDASGAEMYLQGNAGDELVGFGFGDAFNCEKSAFRTSRSISFLDLEEARRREITCRL